MAENILLTFALLFGATVTLICAIYVALIQRKKLEQEYKLKEYKLIKEKEEKNVNF